MSFKTFGDYKYKITDNKEITILKYMGEAEEVTIPDSIEDMPVTEIGRRAFDGCRYLEKITLPEGLKTIKLGCDALLMRQWRVSVHVLLMMMKS